MYLEFKNLKKKLIYCDSNRWEKKRAKWGGNSLPLLYPLPPFLPMSILNVIILSI